MPTCSAKCKRSALIKHYVSITKPGIILGNCITAAGAFLLASKNGQFHLTLFLTTLMGLACIVASACVFNNAIDRKVDAKMERTKNRPLVLNLLPLPHALIFATTLCLIGILFLSFCSLLPLLLALTGFFVYVIVYSLLKYRTSKATLIGSLAGAVPPLVGYSAVTQHLDACALLLFALVCLWQMPHFFAIALYRIEEYAAASLPVLPIKKGSRATKLQMLLYIMSFIFTSLTLTLFHYTGGVYLILTLLLGAAWLYLCMKGFKSKNDKKWARQMFLFSLVTILTLSFAMAI
jgi:heme o synthase